MPGTVLFPHQAHAQDDMPASRHSLVVLTRRCGSHRWAGLLWCVSSVMCGLVSGGLSRVQLWVVDGRVSLGVVVWPLMCQADLRSAHVVFFCARALGSPRTFGSLEMCAWERLRARASQ